MSALGIILGIGGLMLGAASSYSQQKAANKQAKVSKLAARRAAASDYAALAEQALQMYQAANVEAFDRRRQALKERSRILVSAGEAGVGGNSLTRQIAQSMFDESYDLGIRSTNIESYALQNKRQREDIAAGLQTRFNQADAMIGNPWTAALLGIGSSLPAIYALQRGGK